MAGTAGVGFCKLVIEDATGKTVRDDDDLCLVCRSGRPDTGNWINLPDLGRYVVDRVEFDPLSGVKNRNFYLPVLFLRPAGARRTTPPGPERTGPPKLIPSHHDGSARVLYPEFPAGANARTIASVILPVSLVANLVMVAYREQASDFDEDSRAAASLLRTAEGRACLKESLPARFDLLSREAKHFGSLWARFFAGDSAATRDEIPTSRSEGKVLAFERDTQEWRVTDAA